MKKKKNKQTSFTQSLDVRLVIFWTSCRIRDARSSTGVPSSSSSFDAVSKVKGACDILILVIKKF
jgi:hypothetical protein